MCFSGVEADVQYVYLNQQVGKGFAYSMSVSPDLDIGVHEHQCNHSKGQSDLRWSASQTTRVPVSHKVDMLPYCCCKLRYFSFPRCQQINAEKIDVASMVETKNNIAGEDN